MKKNKFTIISIFMAITLALILTNCKRSGVEKKFGDVFNEDNVLSIQELVTNKKLKKDDIIQVSGKVGITCLSSGCWFLLTDNEQRQIRVELNPLKNLTTHLMGISFGSEVVVKGRLREAPTSGNMVALFVEGVIVKKS